MKMTENILKHGSIDRICCLLHRLFSFSRNVFKNRNTEDSVGVNSLPDDKISHCSNMNQLADDKINMALNCLVGCIEV